MFASLCRSSHPPGVFLPESSILPAQVRAVFHAHGPVLGRLLDLPLALEAVARAGACLAPVEVTPASTCALAENLLAIQAGISSGLEGEVAAHMGAVSAICALMIPTRGPLDPGNFAPPQIARRLLLALCLKVYDPAFGDAVVAAGGVTDCVTILVSLRDAAMCASPVRPRIS